MLADAGWAVAVVEAEPEPGGAVRSGELTLPGFVHDRFSAFYPLAVASPAIGALRLEEHGVRWRRAALPVAHPLPDGRCVALSPDLDETVASLEALGPGDGAAWRGLYARWEQAGAAWMDTLLRPFPPVRGAASLIRAVGPRGLAEFARFALLPARRLAAESFRGPGGGLLLAGNALHSDLGPESAGSGAVGWMLAMLGQEVGFPVPEGGAGALTAALVRRLRSRGGELVCDARVTEVVVGGGRARAVRTADGRTIEAGRAVLADVGAPSLYLDLLDRRDVTAGVVSALKRFEYDMGTVKVDWALGAPIPWTAPDARRAGTLHVADDLDAMTRYHSQLVRGLVPDRPYLVIGQYASFDPTRQPTGAETAWAYTHVPREVRGDAGPGGLRGTWDEREAAVHADRIEAEIERLAPGFRDLIRGRHILTPPMMQAADANLEGGSINGGTAQLHQQLVFRPIPGLSRAETGVRGLYLASASAHPGGGVHGACGANAARAALRGDVVRRVTGR